MAVYIERDDASYLLECERERALDELGEPSSDDSKDDLLAQLRALKVEVQIAIARTHGDVGNGLIRVELEDQDAVAFALRYPDYVREAPSK